MHLMKSMKIKSYLTFYLFRTPYKYLGISQSVKFKIKIFIIKLIFTFLYYCNFSSEDSLNVVKLKLIRLFLQNDSCID